MSDEKDTSQDRLDAIEWEVATALATPGILKHCGTPGCLVVARVDERQGVSVKVVPADWGNCTVIQLPHGIDVQRLCAFCAKTAVGRVPKDAIVAAGDCVCGSCFAGEAEPFE